MKKELFPQRAFAIIFLLLTVAFTNKVKADDTIYTDQQFDIIKRMINTNNDSSELMLNNLLTFAEQQKDTYAKLNYLMLKGFTLMRKGDFESAITQFETFIELENDSGSTRSIDQINRIAMCHKYLSSGKSNIYYEAANQLALKSKYWKGVADSYSGMGQNLELQGDFEGSMEYYIKSSDYYQRYNDSLGLATSMNNIGNSMYYLGEYNQALEYYKKNLTINLLLNKNPEFDNSNHVASGYGNVGMIYNQLGNPDSALHYNLLCMEMMEKLGDAYSLGTIYNNVALVYFDLKAFDKSLEYHLKSKAIKEQIQDKNGLATSLVNIGNIYVALKNYQEAIPNYEKGLAMANEINAPLLQMNACKGLSKAQGETGHYEQALLNYITYSDIKDSLNDLESKNVIAELETKYETAEKEKQLIEQEKQHQAERAQSDAEKAQQDKILYLSVGIGILLLALAFVLFNRLNVTRKQKKLIEEKNRENELLLGEIHHRVKNNLQVVSSLLNLQQRNLKDTDAKEAVIESRNRVRSMALIHKKLYQLDDFSSIEMLDYTKQLAGELVGAFNLSDQNVELDIRFSPLKLDVDTAVPVGLIINELLVNSMKYAFDQSSNPKIQIQMNVTSEELILNYSDNGAGLAHDPSEENSEESFGTRLIQSLTRQLKGVMKTHHESNKGLEYTFQFKSFKTI